MNDRMLQIAQSYHKRHGTLLLVAETEKQKVKELGAHLDELRMQNAQGTLDPVKKAEYDKLGMVWEDPERQEWNYHYQLAKQYKAVFGVLSIPKAYEQGGVKLGAWFEQQKSIYRKDELSLNRQKKLESLGIEWNEKNKGSIVSFSESAIAYYVAKVFPDVITSYKPDFLNGRELDIYIPSLKTGIEYDGGIYHKDLQRDLKKNELCEKFETMLIRVRDKMAPRMQQTNYCKVILNYGNGKRDLDKAIECVLKSLGVPEDKMPDIDCRKDERYIQNKLIGNETYFNVYLESAKHFYKKNGHLFVSNTYKDPTGVRLGPWINELRAAKDFLTEEQVNSLEEIGMVWGSVTKEKWLCNFDKAISYKEIPEDETTIDGKSLKIWFEQQKKDFADDELHTDYKIEAMSVWHKETQQNQKEKNRSSDRDER